ncbi:uncharacterized protein ACVIWU_006154 [Bradyrhizobium sp. USDA 4509]
MAPNTIASAFAPLEQLASQLIPHIPREDDASHDISHTLRVWKNARTIQAIEGGDLTILVPSILLHDCAAVEKNSPFRFQASRHAADKASKLLREQGFSASAIESVAHAIEAHSFSANVPPRTLEAKIVQDADRLDAIGMIGVGRCFHLAGRLRRSLYDVGDPRARNRPHDDRKFAVDHFDTKLLKLASGFQTAAGRSLARPRHERLVRYLDELFEEI